MSGPESGTAAPRMALIAAAAAVVLVLMCCGGLALITGGDAGEAGGARDGQAGGDQLRPDAPVPAQYLQWVLRAGAICPQLGPADIAAQIDLESSWNPNAVAHNPPGRGGDAAGIAQFQAATWTSWGGDADHDGQSSPYDPQDAIMAIGRLMCDNAAWAERMLSAQPPRLRGDVLDLAWAAYFAGRASILAAGGVPDSGATHDYPQHVRDRLGKYAVDTGGDGLPDAGVAGVPAGYTLPTDAQQAAAVAFALAQLGKPYLFGADGPDSYDCSGLMMAAWAHAGVRIARTSRGQVHTGVGVYSLAAMQPGDLVLIPGSHGSQSSPRHVGMYIGRSGDGRQYLVQAPHSGTVVQVTPVSRWASQIAAIRRPVTR